MKFEADLDWYISHKTTFDQWGNIEHEANASIGRLILVKILQPVQCFDYNSIEKERLNVLGNKIAQNIATSF